MDWSWERALLIGEGRISGICIDFVLTKLRENHDSWRRNEFGNSILVPSFVHFTSSYFTVHLLAIMWTSNGNKKMWRRSENSFFVRHCTSFQYILFVHVDITTAKQLTQKVTGQTTINQKITEQRVFSI